MEERGHVTTETGNVMEERVIFHEIYVAYHALFMED